jgi:Flp pilus assembly protein TadD
LVEVARLADPDPWRNQLRALLGRRDLAALQKLAQEADAASLPVQSVQLLGQALAAAGDRPAAVAWLKAAQPRHPGDVWINYYLAYHLDRSEPPRREEAVRYYTVARALRPEVGHALAQALEKAGQCREAVAVFRELTRLRPANVRHCYGLGNALYDAGDLPGAVAAYRQAIELRPEYAEAHCNLGHALRDQGRLREALAALKQANKTWLPADELALPLGPVGEGV